MWSSYFKKIWISEKSLFSLVVVPFLCIARISLGYMKPCSKYIWGFFSPKKPYTWLVHRTEACKNFLCLVVLKPSLLLIMLSSLWCVKICSIPANISNNICSRFIHRWKQLTASGFQSTSSWHSFFTLLGFGFCYTHPPASSQFLTNLRNELKLTKKLFF